MFRIVGLIARFRLAAAPGKAFMPRGLRQGTEALRWRAPYEWLQATPTKNRPEAAPRRKARPS